MVLSPDPQNPGAVLFDAVGTLIEPDPPVAEAYAAVAREQGVELDPAVLRARFRQHFRADEADELRGPLMTDERIEQRRWRRIVAGVLPELPDPERGFEELWSHFARPTAWRCYPDVGPALRELAEAGLVLGIASNFDARLRSVAGGLPELARLREHLVISSEVGYRKPHPHFFEAAAARLNLPPGRILLVGDDMENDWLGARRAGLLAVLLDRDGKRSPESSILPSLLTLVDRILG